MMRPLKRNFCFFLPVKRNTALLLVSLMFIYCYHPHVLGLVKLIALIWVIHAMLMTDGIVLAAILLQCCVLCALARRKDCIKKITQGQKFIYINSPAEQETKGANNVRLFSSLLLPLPGVINIYNDSIRR